jgi:putative FmdB family regulatory protein
VPIYEYRCSNGHNFEVMQSMSDPPVQKCEECGAAVERVFHPVAVHFKGSGFYTTDYGRNRGSAGGSSDLASKKDESKKESKSDSTATKAAESSASSASSDSSSSSSSSTD